MLRRLRTLAAAAMLAAGCSRPPTGRGPDHSVILISMDTTRADALGCYGNSKIRTPNLDRLAARGTLFRHCESTAPITLVAHSSLLTGTDPYVHGARDNGRYRLAPENVTLAEILSQRGFATAAFVGGMVLDREYGLDQGFGVYDDVASSRRPSASAPPPLERRADEVADRAIAWLRAHVERPFFLFVHFYDPHDPYDPPARFRDAGGGDPYLGEIAFVDEQIGRLVDAVRECGAEERTLLAVTADHGESRGQHGEETHSYTVYDAVLRVPLVLEAPGALPAGRAVDATVRSIDVAPTVLDFLGLPPKPDAQGRSLVPLAMGEVSDLELAAYGETLSPFEEFRYAPVRCLTAGGWKYVHTPRPELYHVAEDPDETTDLAAREPDRVAAMRAALRARIESAPHAGETGRLGPMDEEHRKALAALGYAGDDPADAASRAPWEGELALFDSKTPLPNPIDHMATIQSLQRAMTAMARGQLAAAEAAFRRTLELEPDDAERFGLCHENLAFVLAAQGKTDEAIQHYRAALAANPRSPSAHVNFGTTLSKLGRTDEAIAQYEAALADSPANPTAHNDLARDLLQKGRVDEAIAHYREAIRLRPTYFEAYARLAEALRAAKKLDEAAQTWEAALRVDPEFQAARQELAMTLIDLRRHARAEQVLRETLARSPSDVGARLALARLLATAPRAEDRNGAEAVRLAEALVSTVGGRDPRCLDTLAAAYAEVGRFADAARVARQAADLLAAAGQSALAGEVSARVAIFESNRPYHETE
jgi:arylsulfatase A-like enzyme/Tfp pilus assembly protein PilF